MPPGRTCLTMERASRAYLSDDGACLQGVGLEEGVEDLENDALVDGKLGNDVGQ